MKEKLIAGFMAALMALTTIVPVLGATALKDFPTFLGTAGTANFYVVMGATADPSDIAGAVDVAVRLAELSYTTVSTTGGVSATGNEKDTVALSALLSSVITSPVKTIHFSGLQDSVYRWRSNDYDYYEDFVLGTTQMNHDFGTDRINGTEKMVVYAGQVMYEYVFDKTLNGTGDATTKNYTYPINIKLLGKDFSLVGSEANSVVALVGTVGTATATAGVTYGNYTVYSDLGSTTWARVIVKDAAGNTVDTKVINSGDSWDFAAISLTVKITAVRALQDGTVVGVDLVVGPTGTVERTYTTSCDVTSTGTADKKFPGETEWCIQVASWTGYYGSILTGSKIQVVYKPTETKYFVAGQKLSFPNNYGEIGFVGWNTDNFVTLTVKPTEVTVYNYSADTSSIGTWKGLEISADVAGSIINPVDGTGYSKAYVLLNYSLGAGMWASDYPVGVAFWDSVKQKPLMSATGPYYFAMNHTNATADLLGYFNFTFNISYGGATAPAEQQLLLVNVTAPNSTTNTIMKTFTLGGATGVNAKFYNKTNALSAWTTTAIPELRLYTTDSAQDEDVAVTTTDLSGTPASQNIGKASQDVVSDAGNIVVAPSSNSGAQTVKVKVPAKTLYVKAYVGKAGAVTTAGTQKVISPITSAIAVIDTEVTATHKTKDFVTVGGPCVNRITAAALNLTFPACGAASTVPSNAAMIKVVDDYPAVGLQTVVVAGWEKANTRTACTVLQQYDTLLVGQTASAVKVTSATTAGITAL
jgi:hypothetical protein